MYYKQYGNTDLKVSAMGMGTMRYSDDDINAGNLEKPGCTSHERVGATVYSTSGKIIIRNGVIL